MRKSTIMLLGNNFRKKNLSGWRPICLTGAIALFFGFFGCADTNKEKAADQYDFGKERIDQGEEDEIHGGRVDPATTASIINDDIIFKVIENPGLVPSEIRLVGAKKYLLVNDGQLSLNRSIINDDIIFLRMGAAAGSQDSTIATLPKGYALIWSAPDSVAAEKARAFSIRTDDQPPAGDEPDYIISTTHSYILIDARSLTILGYQFSNDGQRRKGFWNYPLNSLKGIYKARSEENKFNGDHNELWIYKNE